MKLSLLVCIGLIFFSLFTQFLYVKKKNNLFSIDSFFLCCFSIFYSFDALHSLISFDAGGYYLSGVFFSWELDSLITSSIIISVAPWVWVFGYQSVTLFKKKQAVNQFQYGYHITFNSKKLFLATVFYMSLSLIAIFIVLNKLGATVGILGYLRDLAQRSIIFSDFTLQNAYINFVLVAATPAAAIAIYKGRKTLKVLGVLLLCLLAFSSLLSGARAPLVQMVFTVVVIRNFYYRKVEFNFKLILMAFLAMVILVQVALSTRTVSIKHDSVIENVFGTGQIPQSNNMHAIFSMSMDGELKGESIANDLLSPIPSFIFSSLGYEKKMGGNTYYTMEFWPSRWENTRSQISLGGVNELLYNYGIVISLVALFFIAYFYSLVEQQICKSVYGPIFMTGLLWSIFQQLRGDYFHTINKMFIFIVSYLILLILLKGVRFKSR